MIWVALIARQSGRRSRKRSFAGLSRLPLVAPRHRLQATGATLHFKKATGVTRVIRNQKTLAERLQKAIWQDLNGMGRESGMWWHGSLDSLNEIFTEPFGTELKELLQSQLSVRRVIGDPSIHIVESVYGYSRPCAKLSFSAAFDPEHGVGVLTDGNRILGVGYGYGYDVGPYKT